MLENTVFHTERWKNGKHGIMKLLQHIMWITLRKKFDKWRYGDRTL
ncbi:hypothetical protein E2C01_040377 [Portunus trituberculatus]|uniref:Uncharacterized protein n=1 Tax=Portunus trituberculatus TaxID=210409 RepID=A0A5B7FNL6_PORTR|nr:hypothetical protein [Portunus trituberculatus]